jgi:hypothetical protein
VHHPQLVKELFEVRAGEAPIGQDDLALGDEVVLTCCVAAFGCNDRHMNQTVVYRRSEPSSADVITVMSYINPEDDDGDEIRVIHSRGDLVVSDSIEFHGHGGQEWLRDRHADWTREGYELITSRPGV